MNSLHVSKIYATYRARVPVRLTILFALILVVYFGGRASVPTIQSNFALSAVTPLLLAAGTVLALFGLVGNTDLIRGLLSAAVRKITSSDVLMALIGGIVFPTVVVLSLLVLGCTTYRYVYFRDIARAEEALKPGINQTLMADRLAALARYFPDRSDIFILAAFEAGRQRELMGNDQRLRDWKKKLDAALDEAAARTPTSLYTVETRRPLLSWICRCTPAADERFDNVLLHLRYKAEKLSRSDPDWADNMRTAIKWLNSFEATPNRLIAAAVFKWAVADVTLETNKTAQKQTAARLSDVIRQQVRQISNGSRLSHDLYWQMGQDALAVFGLRTCTEESKQRARDAWKEIVSSRNIAQEAAAGKDVFLFEVEKLTLYHSILREAAVVSDNQPFKDAVAPIDKDCPGAIAETLKHLEGLYPKFFGERREEMWHAATVQDPALRGAGVPIWFALEASDDWRF